MKTLAFSLFLIAILAFSIGCDSTICTDSFCIVPRADVEGSVIEVDETKVLALIASTDGITPAPIPLTAVPEPDSTALLMTIIEDVGRNGADSQYNGQTVTVTGYVVWKNDDGESMAIYKNTNFLAAGGEPAIFLILSRAEGVKLDQYSVPEKYTFTFTINAILPPKPPNTRYTIGGRLLE